MFHGFLPLRSPFLVILIPKVASGSVTSWCPPILGKGYAVSHTAPGPLYVHSVFVSNNRKLVCSSWPVPNGFLVVAHRLLGVQLSIHTQMVACFLSMWLATHPSSPGVDSFWWFFHLPSSALLCLPHWIIWESFGDLYIVFSDEKQGITTSSSSTSTQNLTGLWTCHHVLKLAAQCKQLGKVS